MADDLTILRYISWRDICPWILLVRVFRVAVQFSTLSLAFVAVICSTLTWSFARTCCLSEATLANPEFTKVRSEYESWPEARIDLQLTTISDDLRNQNLQVDLHDVSPVTSVFRSFTGPFLWLFDRQVSWDQWFYFLLGGTFDILIWSFFGIAISRIATVRLGRGDTVPLTQAIDFSFHKWLSSVAAPLMPILLMAILSLPLILAGLAIRIDIGAAMVGLLWAVIVFLGLMMSGLGIGLFFGWPLMWGSIATESNDAFDAISRSYSYTFQRPLQYLFYALVATLLGILGWIVVWFVTELSIQLAGWSVSFGAGETRWDELGQAMKGTAPNASAATNFAVWMIGLVHAVVRTLVVAFCYSFFWAAANGIYLLLRLDTDQTELDDIYFDDEDIEASTLPQFDLDSADVAKAQAEE